MRSSLLLYLVIYVGVMLLTRWVIRTLKRRGSHRDTTRTALLVFAVVAGLVVGISTPFLFIRLADAGIIRQSRGPEPVDTYTYTTADGRTLYTRDVYRDPLPVTLEDLGYTVTEDDYCTYRAETRRSLVAAHGEYSQDALNFDSSLPDLSYRTFTTAWPWLLDACWDRLVQTRADRPWPLIQLSPAPWGAQEAWQEDDLRTYLLRYPDRIVTIRVGSDMGEAQLDQLAGLLAAK